MNVNETCSRCKHFDRTSGGWACQSNTPVDLTAKGYRAADAGVPNADEWGCPEFEPP
jgi:hypothetical protein